MTTTIRCVACQMVESEAFAASSTISFLTMAPCDHTICSDCYSNPCTLVQCYGCPACGTIPTGTSPLSTSSSSAHQTEKEEVEVHCSPSATFDCSTTLDSLYYTGLSTSSQQQYTSYPTTTSYSYSYSYSYYQEEQEEKKQEVEEEEVKMVEMTSSDIHEYVSTHGMTDLPSSSSSYDPSSSFSASSAAGEEVEEEPKGEEGVEEKSVSSSSSTTSPSEASSTSKKRRRQKKSGKGSVSRWEGTNAKPSKAPSVIVPKECPDHLRPKRKPAPTTCREHGRRWEREATLRKIRRGKDEDMRKMKEIGRNMSCC